MIAALFIYATSFRYSQSSIIIAAHLFEAQSGVTFQQPTRILRAGAKKHVTIGALKGEYIRQCSLEECSGLRAVARVVRKRLLLAIRICEVEAQRIHSYECKCLLTP
jgi:hypothetical protein